MMKVFVLFLSLAMLAGCSGTQERAPQTPEERAGLIRSLTQSATVVGLSAGFDDEEQVEQAEVAGLIVKWAEVVRVAVEDEQVTWDTMLAVFEEAFPDSDLPPEVDAAVQSALQILNLYVRPPDTSAVLDLERRLYVQAFLDGVVAGATPFLSEEE